MDAVVAHSEHGARAAARARSALDPERRPRDPPRRLRLPDPPAGRDAAAGRAGRGRGPGDPLLRPAPPLQGHRHPARGLPPSRGRRALDRRHAADATRAAARARRGAPRARSASSPASSTTPRSRRSSAAPTSSSCPTATIEHSGVLYTALAFGKPLVLSAVGGFPEVGERRRRPAGPAGGPGALAAALESWSRDPAARAELAAAAAAPRRALLLGRVAAQPWRSTRSSWRR